MTGFHLRHGQLHHHDRIASGLFFTALARHPLCRVRHVFDLPAAGQVTGASAQPWPDRRQHPQEEQRFTESDH
jgi:hypothetical protein